MTRAFERVLGASRGLVGAGSPSRRGAVLAGFAAIGACMPFMVA